MGFKSRYLLALIVLWSSVVFGMQSQTSYSDISLGTYCDASVLKTLDRFMKEGDTLEVQSEMYLALKKATGIENPQFDLVRVDKAFNNFAHIVVYGLGATPKLFSYAYRKNSAFRFARYNSLDKQVNLQRYNPTFGGNDFCKAPRANSTTQQLAFNEVSGSQSRPKSKLKFFKQKQVFDSKSDDTHSSYTRVGVSHDIAEGVSLRAGPEWNSSPNAPDNYGVGVSLMIKGWGKHRKN